jgi:hypothetical protein
MYPNRHPELIIGYDPDGSVTEAVCSLCGDNMPKADPPFMDTRDAISAFSIEFVRHVHAKHPGFTPNLTVAGTAIE